MPSTRAQRRFAVITDEAVEQLRRLIGVPIVDTVEPWCYEATRDNIRHYAHGIGDDNPLWCDPDLRGRDRLRHGRGAAELRVRPQPVLLRATSAGCPASTPCGPAPTSRGTRRSRRGDEIAHGGPPRRTSSSTRPASPGGRSSRSTTSSFAAGDGTLLCRGRLVVLPHRARHGPRGGHQVRGRQGATGRGATRRRSSSRSDALYEAEAGPRRRAPLRRGRRRSARSCRRWPRAR